MRVPCLRGQGATTLIFGAGFGGGRAVAGSTVCLAAVANVQTADDRQSPTRNLSWRSSPASIFMSPEPVWANRSMASSTWSRSRFGNRWRSLAACGRNSTRFMPVCAGAVQTGCREMHRLKTTPPRFALPLCPARRPVARPGSPIPLDPPTRAEPCGRPAHRSRVCGPPRCVTRGGRISSFEFTRENGEPVQVVFLPSHEGRGDDVGRRSAGKRPIGDEWVHVMGRSGRQLGDPERNRHGRGRRFTPGRSGCEAANS